ncbi:MAG: lysostaphin resistance A-like protein [Gemmatimonadales bacterium]
MAWFLAIAFGLAWGMWGLLFALGITPRVPSFQIWGTFPGFAPAVAAIITRHWIEREGFADAGMRPNLRASWGYYLLAWLMPLGIAALITGLAVLLQVSTPDPTLARAYAVLSPETGPPAPLLSFPLPVMPLLLSLFTTVLMWGEEFGWRGYFQIRIFEGSPLSAAVVTGLVWAWWHTPMILTGGDQYAATPLLGMIVFPITGVLLSIIWAWLRKKTGSVWVCCLAHGATNSVGSLMVVSLFYGGPNWTLVSYFGLLGWIPLGAICLWLIARGEFAPPAEQPAPGGPP